MIILLHEGRPIVIIFYLPTLATHPGVVRGIFLRAILYMVKHLPP